MSQVGPKPNLESFCRDCGAGNDPGASECWLCHRPDWQEGAVGATPRFAEDPQRETPLSMANRIVWVVLSLVLLGTIAVAPGLGIGLIILVVLMAIPVWGARAITKEMSPLARAVGIVVLSLVFFVLQIVAVVIALYLFCMATGLVP